MVGRELPNLRPHGEDHPGVDRGGMLRPKTTFGIPDVGSSRNWTAMTRIHKALVWKLPRVIDGLLVMNFDSRV